MEGKLGVKVTVAVRGAQDAVKDMKANSPTFNMVDVIFCFLRTDFEGWIKRMCVVKKHRMEMFKIYFPGLGKIKNWKVKAGYVYNCCLLI